MFKKILYFFGLILMSNCTMSGTAFLGPAFTGVKTGSIYQSSLSYGSGKIVSSLKSPNFSTKVGLNRINNNIPDIPFSNKNPLILIAYKVDSIEFSEVLEPEPLP